MFIFECQCQHFQMAFCLGDYNKGLCKGHHPVNQMIVLTSANSFFHRYFTIHTIETITPKYNEVWAIMGLP